MIPTDLSDRRLLGQSVHPLGVGCWGIGGPTSHQGAPTGWSTAVDDARSLQGLREALAHGARFLDTADAYGFGHSERLIGRLLEEVPRTSILIASKVGTMRGTAPHPYAAPHLHQQVKQTLENLGTDYLDLLWCHSTDFGPGDRYLPDAAATLKALRDDGVIGAVGLCLPAPPSGDAFTAQRLALFIDRLQPQALACPFNALTPEIVIDGEDIFAFTERRGLDLILAHPLAHGLLTGTHQPSQRPAFGSGDHRTVHPWYAPTALPVVRRALRQLRDRFGNSEPSLIRVALRYCLQRSRHAIVVVGYTRPEQITMNYNALADPLSPAELAAAEAIYHALRDALRQLPVKGGRTAVSDGMASV